MSEYSSAEYKVMKWATDKLCDGFRSAHQSLCRAFFSKDLITRQVEYMCNNWGDRETFLHTMVTTLQDRVKNDTNAYYTILGILQDETGLSYLGDILERRLIVEKMKMTERQEAEKKSIKAEQSYSAATDDLTKTAEERNATATRNSAMVSVYMTPQTVSFRGQRYVSSNEGGDILLLASGRENYPDDKTDGSSFMEPSQSQLSVFKVEETEKKTRGLLLTNTPGTENRTPKSESNPYYKVQHSNEQSMATPTAAVAHAGEGIDGNKLSQSNKTNTRDMTESMSKYVMCKKRETQLDGGREDQKEKDEVGQKEAEAWAEESTERTRSENVGLIIPNNIYGRSRSVFSDNSDIFERPTIASPSDPLDPPFSPTETRRKACRKCQFFKTKIQTLEDGMQEKLWLVQSWEESYQMQIQHHGEQIEIHQRMLYEKEEEKSEMHTGYDARHKEMVSLISNLKLKLRNLTEQMKMNKESEIVQKRIFEHEKQTEMQQLKKENLKLKKEKDKAEREREWVNTELDQAKKEVNQAEKVFDQAEKDRHDEKSKWLQKELHYIGREIKRANSLQCGEDLAEYQRQ